MTVRGWSSWLRRPLGRGSPGWCAAGRGRSRCACPGRARWPRRSCRIARRPAVPSRPFTGGAMKRGPPSRAGRPRFGLTAAESWAATANRVDDVGPPASALIDDGKPITELAQQRDVWHAQWLNRRQPEKYAVLLLEGAAISSFEILFERSILIQPPKRRTRHEQIVAAVRP